MADKLATAWIQLQPSFEGVQASIAKELSGSGVADKAGTQAGHGFVSGASKGLKGLAGVIGAAFVTKKVVDFFTDSMDAVKNWQVLNSQTAAVVKSTGGAANVTAQQVHDLASSLEGMTATQAESIQEGANMLLTFKNITNGVGEGNDIFNRATASLVDMSRAMGTDPQTAAIQLGKALNDPIQGISALSRVGIQFTEDQKALIKSLVETGDTAGAQKIILEELNSQFGGSGAAYAETYAGKLFLLQDAFGDIGEELVTNLMPHLEDLLGWLSTDGMTAVEDFTGVVGDMKDGLAELKEQDWFSGILEALGPGGALDIAGQLSGKESMAESWGRMFEGLPEAFENARVQINDFFAPAKWENGWNQVKAANDAASDFIAAQFEQSGADWLAKFDNGRQQINAAAYWMWDQIVAAGANGWAQIVGAFSNGWTQVTTWWNSLWDTVWNTITTVSASISGTIASFIGGMVGGFANGWAQITSFFSSAAATINGIVNGVLTTFQNVANGIRSAFDGIGQFMKDAFGPILDFMGGVGANIANFFGGMGDRARHVKGKLQAAAAGGVGGGGGAALARVRATLPSGLRVTDTLSNPARDRALGLARSANSYHYDASNPAVDIAGPIPLLHQYARQLMAMGGWRQFLWQVPGHYDHIHVAHSGGVVSPSWARMPGDRYDERTVRLQVGETVLPRGFGAAEFDSSRGGPAGAAVVINGDVITTDVDEFFEFAERKKRVAVALAGLEGLEG